MMMTRGGLPFSAVRAAVIIQLATGACVKAGQQLCLIGDSGTGKSHLLIGLVTGTAEQGESIRYTLTSKLVNELVETFPAAIASNAPFSSWLDKDFRDPRLCGAIVDRLTSDGQILETGTTSYRLEPSRANRTSAS